MLWKASQIIQIRKVSANLIATLLISPYSIAASSLQKNAFWIWAGIPIEKSTPGSDIYLYQGNFIPDQPFLIDRKGLLPHTVENRKFYIVIRLKKIKSPELLTRKALEIIKSWEAFNNKISGLQLDFDSPTTKLLEYSVFLQSVRKDLPIQYKLSVTGLSDWIRPTNQTYLKQIANSTNEMVFQLYQGRNTLPLNAQLLNSFQKFSFPFKIGLLKKDTRAPQIQALLKVNPNYLGEIYFLQNANLI